MRTIPNLATVINPETIFVTEVKSFVEEGDFVWLDLRKWDEDCRIIDEDEIFHLCILNIGNDSIDFATPFGILHLEMQDYDRTWRLWNLCPNESEPWRRCL